MKWKIYYGDGSTFSDRDGEPFYAPGANVQVIAQESKNERGFILMKEKDFYYWNRDIGWNGCDLAGMMDYHLSYIGPGKVLCGRAIRDEDFWALVGRAGVEGID